VRVQPHQDLLRQVVHDDPIGYAAGNERAESLVQFRPHRFRHRALLIDRYGTGVRYRHAHPSDAAAAGGQQLAFSDGAQHVSCSLVSQHAASSDAAVSIVLVSLTFASSSIAGLDTHGDGENGGRMQAPHTSMIVDTLTSVDMKSIETAIVCCAPLAAPVLDEEEAVATAELFKALGDPARIRIVNVLATTDDPVCVCELIEPLGLAQPTVSHHLKKLLDAGLLEREQRGKWAYFSLRRDAVEKLAAVADLRP